MNKRNVQAFGFGVIFATCVIAIYYYFLAVEKPLSNQETAVLNVESATKFLMNENYLVMTANELEDLKEKAVKEAVDALETQKKPETPTIQVINYTLDIMPGTNTLAVAKELKENKIIEDEDAFHFYLASNDLSKRIQIGTYELNSSMSIEEIAKLITNTKNE